MIIVAFGGFGINSENWFHLLESEGLKGFKGESIFNIIKLEPQL